MSCTQHAVALRDEPDGVYVVCLNPGCAYRVDHATWARSMLEWLQAREQRSYEAFVERATEYVASLTPAELVAHRAEASKGWPNLDEAPLLEESDPPRPCTEDAVRNMDGNNSHDYISMARGDNVVQRDGSVIMRCACGHRKVARTADDYGPKYREQYSAWDPFKQAYDGDHKPAG